MKRIGIATWTLGGDDLDTKLRLLADMGYNAASVLGNFLEHTSPDDLSAVERTLEELDLVLTVHSNFNGPDKTPDEAKTVTQAERILDWHARTGRIAALTYDAPKIEVSTGVRRVDVTTIRTILTRVLSLTPGSGIRVGMEDYPLNTADLELLPDWAKTFPHWGILVDLGHMNMRLRKPRHDVQPLAPHAVENYLSAVPLRIVELHIHSNDGSADQHMPPYAGNADLASAARRLNDAGFDGISTIEIVPAWAKLDSDEVLPAVRKSLEFWNDLMDSSRPPA